MTFNEIEDSNSTGCTMVSLRQYIKNECERFIRGSKHRETDESTRPAASCFYCFEVFGTPKKHEARVLV